MTNWYSMKLVANSVIGLAATLYMYFKPGYMTQSCWPPSKNRNRKNFVHGQTAAENEIGLSQANFGLRICVLAYDMAQNSRKNGRQTNKYGLRYNTELAKVRFAPRIWRSEVWCCKHYELYRRTYWHTRWDFNPGIHEFILPVERALRSGWRVNKRAAVQWHWLSGWSYCVQRQQSRVLDKFWLSAACTTLAKSLWKYVQCFRC